MRTYTIYIVGGHIVVCLQQRAALLAPLTGTQFTCFTGTKVQILTQIARRSARAACVMLRL
jgi:hypothetical protein